MDLPFVGMAVCLQHRYLLTGRRLVRPEHHQGRTRDPRIHGLGFASDRERLWNVRRQTRRTTEDGCGVQQRTGLGQDCKIRFGRGVGHDYGGSDPSQRVHHRGHVVNATSHFLEGQGLNRAGRFGFEQVREVGPANGSSRIVTDLSSSYGHTVNEVIASDRHTSRLGEGWSHHAEIPVEDTHHRTDLTPQMAT